MKSVKDPQHTETLVKPEVVEVVELWGGQERQVVATVGDSGADQSQAVPQAGGAEVRAQQHWAQSHWEHVGDHVLQGVGVDAHDANGCCPLVVLFMVRLVQTRVVEQSVRVVEEYFLQDGEGTQFYQCPVEGGQLWTTRRPTQAHQMIGCHHHRPRDAHLVKEHRLQGVAQLCRVDRVVFVLLNPVSGDEGRFCCYVHDQQQSVGPPEHHSGNKHSSEVEQSFVVALKRHMQLGPLFLPEIS